MPEHVLYTAVYGNVEDALFDLDTLEELHAEEAFGKFDAAVIDMQDGKLSFVKEAEGALVPVLLEKYGQEVGAGAAGAGPVAPLLLARPARRRRASCGRTGARARP